MRTITREEICQHTPPCKGKQWFEVTVPNYRTYHKAFHWLRSERNYPLISAQGVMNKQGQYTGEYTFKFLCEQEYIWFALRWA